MSGEQIKLGYKRTEVGVIPEEWGCECLVNVTQIITCGVAATPSYVDESFGRPFLSAQNVRSGRVIFDDYKSITPDWFEKITRHNKPKRGDLLYTRVGAGIGQAAVIDFDDEFGIYVSLTLIRTKKQFLHSLFLSHLLNSQKYQNIAKSGQYAGGGVQNLNVEVVRKFWIPLPSLREQISIASVCSDIDALLTKLDQEIAKRRELKQATMQQLLTGKTRLPGFFGDWVTMKIGEICDYVHGVKTAGGDMGYIEIGDIDVELKSYDLSQKEKLSVPGAVKVPEGTLLISTVRPTRGAIAVTHSAEYVSSAFCRLRSANGLLFHLVCQPKFLAYLGENSIGGTYPTCRTETILSYETMLPCDPDEQVAIATVLSDMDAEIAALQLRRDKVLALKTGMMPELLTGSVRLL